MAMLLCLHQQPWPCCSTCLELLNNTALPPRSTQETDYLLDMCQRFELRFVTIADRYEVRAWLSGGQAWFA